MKKTTVFFYTNNFLNRKILEATLREAVQHCVKNNAFLLVTSHYPISKDFINASKDFQDHIIEDKIPEEMKYLYVKDLEIDFCGIGVNYVVGRLPYKAESILKQLIFSCEHCKTENAVLFEHDCFYPQGYIEQIEKSLNEHRLCYCMESYLMVNKNGFFLCEPHPFLSSFSAKNNYFYDIFLHKKKIYVKKNKPIRLLEPFISYKLIKKRINWKNGIKRPVSLIIKPLLGQEIENKSILESKNAIGLKDEMLINDGFCVDGLFVNCPILELQHGVNTTNSLFLMRDVYDNSILDTDDSKYGNLIMEHSYWGKPERFVDMVKINDSAKKHIEDIEKAGLHVFNV